MDNEFETEEPFIVTTADMLEIVAGGGNGSEYVDVSGLIETAAKELREKDNEIEQLRKLEARYWEFASKYDSLLVEIERLREENNDLKSALMNVLFSEVSHVEITEFTKEKE
jgi:hypothetical protein